MTVEVVAYAYRMGAHMVGIKVVSGREPQAGDTLSTIGPNNTRWLVKSLGTAPASTHQAGIRPVVLWPENEAARLAVGDVLTLQ